VFADNTRKDCSTIALVCLPKIIQLLKHFYMLLHNRMYDYAGKILRSCDFLSVIRILRIFRITESFKKEGNIVALHPSYLHFWKMSMLVTTIRECVSVDVLVYLVKLLMYLLLVVISGNVLVNSLITSSVSIQRREKMDNVINQAVKGLLLVIVLGIFVQIISWTQQLKPESDQLISLFLEGSTGRVWLALLVLSILLTLLNNKNFTARIVLVLAMLLAESMNGHASGDSIVILFDFIHLTAVSIWVGGVIQLWWNWRESKELAISFIGKFSKLLWLTIGLVSISGILMTLNILPSWSYLLYTSWGQILLVKIAAVLITLWLGYKAKVKISASADENSGKNGKTSFRPVIAEFSVLVIVIAFATVVGLLNPEPSGDKALNHHEMGEELHFTFKLYPNAPGPNKLSLSLWTLEEEGEVDSVELALQATDKQKAMPKVVGLEAAQLDTEFEFPGFIESQFTLEELKLPYPSTWQALVTITFADGGEREFSFQFEN